MSIENLYSFKYEYFCNEYDGKLQYIKVKTTSKNFFISEIHNLYIICPVFVYMLFVYVLIMLD